MYVSNVRQLSRYRRTRKIFSATRRIRTLSSVHILFAFLSSLTSSTPLDKLLRLPHVVSGPRCSQRRRKVRVTDHVVSVNFNASMVTGADDCALPVV